MKKYPAIALIEYSSIATGILSGDAMVKQAPITVIKSGTVHNGKYLVMIGGSVASVEEAYVRGLSVGEHCVLDSVILPDIHNQLHDSILGSRISCKGDSLGIIETSTVAAMIKATDAGVKGADVNIVEIRLADDLGGKAFTIFNGKVEEVDAAIRSAKETVTDQDAWVKDTLIPRAHEDMKTQIDQTTRFVEAGLVSVDGGEI